MATGAVPASFSGLKMRESSLGFGKSVDFVRNCDRGRKRISMIQNSNTGPEIVELQPASEGRPLLVPIKKYCESINNTVRRKTRTLVVGNVPLGSEHPVRVQTMTTTDTKDVAATVEQVMRIADKGADIVRITVQGKTEADACFEIKTSLVQKKQAFYLFEQIKVGLIDYKKPSIHFFYAEQPCLQLLYLCGYNIPLVSDIHFAPSVAFRVAECFDKIRVNPGNFGKPQGPYSILLQVMNAIDRRFSLRSQSTMRWFIAADRRALFEKLEYTEDDYEKELEHIEKVFTPLVEKCKKYGRAMRIGTYHGSLSDRIMSYYGDSPRGIVNLLMLSNFLLSAVLLDAVASYQMAFIQQVESAFEFARICRKLDFHNFVFSMKASNPVVMVQAYRLLVAEMYVQGWDYTLHLGVTEAGEGEDGRMKSAIGIGTLLQGFSLSCEHSLSLDCSNSILAADYLSILQTML